ncbi:hypothetical protein M8C21_023414 [Ambrosia artemisiifolia]|uniref:Uncharacterized protein n=1 Tax=Ambrosia artemisiifolia TaxID=4212 RepID=A0AAD5D4F9_AMBAR|nr:hypothetical protein M8C21_023414 [Ambrosia artemisiifolia]
MQLTDICLPSNGHIQSSKQNDKEHCAIQP